MCVLIAAFASLLVIIFFLMCRSLLYLYIKLLTHTYLEECQISGHFVIAASKHHGYIAIQTVQRCSLL